MEGDNLPASKAPIVMDPAMTVNCLNLHVWYGKNEKRIRSRYYYWKLLMNGQKWCCGNVCGQCHQQ